MKLLGQRLSVRRDQADDTTASGIKLNTDNVRLNTGTVVSIGDEVSEVAVGNRVLFEGSYSLTNVEGEELVVMLESNIMAII